MKLARASFSWKLALRLLRLAVVGYLCAILAMRIMEPYLVYPTWLDRQVAGPPRGIPVEDAWFAAPDGPRLHGWYAHQAEPTTVVLFCHGNGDCVQRLGYRVQEFYRDCHASVLVFDYRGYGRSQGTPDEAGILADARAARRWLAERAGVGESEIVLVGESLGGGVAVDLAASDGARGLVLEKTFTSLPDVAAWHFPWMPVQWLMRNRLDSAAKIGRYRGPVLQGHGTADRTVPFASGQRLHALIPGPKQFVVWEDCDHNDIGPAHYQDSRRRFLAELPR